MMNGKHVIVTGGAGFVGSNLVRKLLDLDAIVHVFLKSTSDRSRLADVLHLLVVHEVDLTNSQQVEEAVRDIKPEGVFHLAALNPRYGMVPATRDFFETNTLTTINLMDALNHFEYRFFIHTGTFAEVGPQDTPIREDAMCAPTESYSISKLAGTLYGQMLGKMKGKPIVTIRVFTPYGPYMQKGKIVTQLIEGALAQKQIKLSHKDVTRDFIYIDDLTDLYVRLSQVAELHPGEIFNGGTGVGTELGKLVAVVECEANAKIPVVWSNELASYDHAKWQADTTKVHKKIGWSPSVSLEEGIKKSVDWFLANQNYWKEDHT